MNSKQEIQEFLGHKTLAFAGLSRNPQSFSVSAFKELTGKGYRLFPVNPNASSIGGQTCYPSVKDLPEKVEGVVLFTPSSETEKVVREAAAAGICQVWIQRGAESEPALRFCREKGLNAISGQCIFLFAEPVTSIHGVHRGSRAFSEGFLDSRENDAAGRRCAAHGVNFRGLGRLHLREQPAGQGRLHVPPVLQLQGIDPSTRHRQLDRCADLSFCGGCASRSVNEGPRSAFRAERRRPLDDGLEARLRAQEERSEHHSRCKENDRDSRGQDQGTIPGALRIVGYQAAAEDACQTGQEGADRRACRGEAADRAVAQDIGLGRGWVGDKGDDCQDREGNRQGQEAVVRRRLGSHHGRYRSGQEWPRQRGRRAASCRHTDRSVPYFLHGQVEERASPARLPPP